MTDRNGRDGSRRSGGGSGSGGRGRTGGDRSGGRSSRSGSSDGRRSGRGDQRGTRRGGDERRRSDRTDGRGRGGDGSRSAGSVDRRISVHPGSDLPKWLRDEVSRTTPKDRRAAALTEIQRGIDALGDERGQAAQVALRKAKSLSPRVATIRELLGIAAYRAEDWEEALRELRTYRRLTGESTQMPLEMDCLRALGRDRDPPKLWETFIDLRVDPATDDEMRVVYASWLADRGEISDAWHVIEPGRLVAQPTESRLRRWAVAARVAHAAGDVEATEKLLGAIRKAAPDIDWLADLEAQLE